MRRRGWVVEVNAESVPLVPAGQRHTESAVEHHLGVSFPLSLFLSLAVAPVLLLSEQRSGETLVGEQRHRRERYALESCVVLRVRRQEARAHSGVVEDRLPNVGRDFLEEDNVGGLGSEDTVKDELGALDALVLEGRGVDIPRCERQPLADSATVRWARRRRLWNGCGMLA